MPRSFGSRHRTRARSLKPPRTRLRASCYDSAMAMTLGARRRASMEGTPIPTHVHPTNPPTERAMLAAVRWNENGWKTDDSLEELARLAETADLEVVGAVSQNLSRPNPASYLGKGKVQEVKAAREELNYDV